MSVNAKIWLVVIGAAAGGLVTGVAFNSLAAGVAGVAIGAGAIRLTQLALSYLGSDTKDG